MSINIPVVAAAKELVPAATISAVAAGAAIDGDFWYRIGAVLVGLVLGAVWRAGSLKSEGGSWDSVWADLIISALIGGANAVMAMIIVDHFGASILISMGIGVLVGATGVRAIQEAKEISINMMKKFFGEK